MKDRSEIGYTKEQYYQISTKQGLPNRCPLLGNCRQAFETRYEMDIGFSGTRISFDEFLRSIGITSSDTMIKSGQLPPSSRANGAITTVEDVCPEIMLFEANYLPINFVQSAFGYASYYEDSHRFQAISKHYSECAEFSKISSHQNVRTKPRGATLSDLTVQFPEKALEDYLEVNLERLEPGLKFLERQKKIGKWKADIFALDSCGVDVLIELKSKALNRVETDKLCGQVSRYYNHLKSDDRDLRVLIVIPRNDKGFTVNLYHGLKP